MLKLYKKNIVYVKAVVHILNEHRSTGIVVYTKDSLMKLVQKGEEVTMSIFKNITHFYFLLYIPKNKSYIWVSEIPQDIYDPTNPFFKEKSNANLKSFKRLQYTGNKNFKKFIEELKIKEHEDLTNESYYERYVNNVK